MPWSDTPPSRPLRRDAERNLQRILATARRVFAARGLGATLDDIAAAAGVGVGTVYRRFPNKKALLKALFGNKIRELVEIAQEALQQPSGWQGLCFFLERAHAVQAQDRGLRQMLMCDRDEGDQASQTQRELGPLVADLIRRAQAEGALRSDLTATDIPLIAVMISGIMDQCSAVKPELWRRYLTIILDGLRATRDAATPLTVDPLTEEQIERVMGQGAPCAGHGDRGAKTDTTSRP